MQDDLQANHKELGLMTKGFYSEDISSFYF